MKKSLFFLLSIILLLGLFGFSERSVKERSIPETKDAREIMKTVEKAYDIEAEAAYTRDLSKFSTVFINDPRFNVSPGTLETIRELTNNPSLESAGWLDYKMAYHSWRINSTLHAENVRAKAKSENRELTDEEKKSLVDSNGRTAPVLAQGPTKKIEIQFLSVEIHDDIALVVVNDGPTTVELTLVLVDGQWYIAAYRGMSVHP